MRRFIVLIIVVAVGAVQLPQWVRAQDAKPAEQYDLALKYWYGRGVVVDRKEAFKHFRAAAEAKHPPAMFMMGEIYYNNYGLIEDNRKTLIIAYEWWVQAEDAGYAPASAYMATPYHSAFGKEHLKGLLAYAAEMLRDKAALGDPAYQFGLGTMYNHGYGVPQNDKLAFEWNRKAAEQGFAPAQVDLGTMFENGRGTTKNGPEAAKWYRKAADQDSAVAQYNLGTLYDGGIVIEKDESSALLWYRKAVAQGHPAAMNNLGSMYLDGRGVEKDEFQAVILYRKASAQHGLAIAVANLKNLGERNFKIAQPLDPLLLITRTRGIELPTPAVNAPTQYQGVLQSSDPLDPVRKRPAKVHVIELKAGKTYVIDLKSRQFDTFLRLEDAGRTQLAYNDDGGGNLNSRIVFSCQTDGRFRLIATSFGDRLGEYTLQVTYAIGKK